MSKYKISFITLVAALSISNSAYAQQVTSAALSISGREITVSGDNSLRLNLTVNLNTSPKKECRLTLFASTSEIGNDEGTTRTTVFNTKLAKNSARKVKLSYSGPAVSGTEELLTQANFQARIICKNEEAIFSNTEATNVTCQDGLEPRDFLTQLKRRIK